MRGRPRGEPPKTDAPDDLPTLFGKNLREARIKANLTQAQVAERTGLTQQYVSLVEAGHRNITLGTMTALAGVVGQDVRTLLRKRTRPPAQVIVHAPSGTTDWQPFPIRFLQRDGRPASISL
jgi:transcriptional regulator with XRE-family HTH domain